MPADLPIAGSCDCHVHVVGPVERYPQRTGRTYTAMPAALDSLRAAAEPLGVDRFVIVQPSFYGNDNQCLLETLDRLGERGRGVAAVDAEEASPGLLRGLGQRGVRGLRVNLYSESRDRSRQQPNEILEKTARILPDAGWHVEIVAPLKTLTAAAAVIERTEETFVIDHYGLPGESSPESDEGRRLLHLAALPRVWVKLSAPYRTGNDPMATAPLAGWLEALLRVAPDRCLWASDWPYTPAKKDQKGANMAVPYRHLDYRRLLAEFCEALPDPGLAAQILTANPRRLYGFPSEP